MLQQLTTSVGQLALHQQQAIGAIAAAVQARPTYSSLENIAQGLKPPQFSGEKDTVELDTWLFQVEEYFLTLPALDEPTRIRAAGLMLKGQAASWYRDVMRKDAPPQNWAAFKQAICSMFMPIGREKQARHKLDKASQRAQESVAAYTAHMRHLFLSIGPGVSDEERLYRYV